MGVIDYEVLGVADTLQSDGSIHIRKPTRTKQSMQRFRYYKIHCTYLCTAPVRGTLHFIPYLPKKQFHKGLFSVASFDPLGENILASSLVTSRRSLVSTLYRAN